MPYQTFGRVLIEKTMSIATKVIENMSIKWNVMYSGWDDLVRTTKRWAFEVIENMINVTTNNYGKE